MCIFSVLGLGQYLGGQNIRGEEGGVAIPVQGPAHQHQLQDRADNLQHASLHTQVLPFPRYYVYSMRFPGKLTSFVQSSLCPAMFILSIMGGQRTVRGRQ